MARRLRKTIILSNGVELYFHCGRVILFQTRSDKTFSELFVREDELKAALTGQKGAWRYGPVR